MALSLRRLGADERGATTAEYGITVVVMAAIVVALAISFRGSLNSLYDSASNKVAAATADGSAATTTGGTTTGGTTTGNGNAGGKGNGNAGGNGKGNGKTP